MKVAFVGHRKTPESPELKSKIFKTVKELIVNEGANAFYFGSKSVFDGICLDVVTELKEVFPEIKRVYARSMYEEISEQYRNFLLRYYDETFMPDGVAGAGFRAYIKRNNAMIDLCDVLVTYCDPSSAEKKWPRSGTYLAVKYAKQRKKRIINMFE